MQRIPSSHDKKLKTSSEQFYEQFRTRPPEHYWLDTQTSIHRAAAIDIRKAEEYCHSCPGKPNSPLWEI